MLSALAGRFDEADMTPAAAPRSGSFCVAFLPTD